MSQSTSSPKASTDRKASWSSQARNPVSLRLYKVLGTNFDDEATRESLATLSDLYAKSSNIKGKDIQRAIDVEEERNVKADTSSFVETVPGESAARARKNLRHDMETKLTEGSQHFLKVLGEVDEKLATLQKHVAAMRSSCDEAEKQLQQTDESSKSLLERAGNLREERQEVEVKRSIVSLFLSRFTLTEEEAEAMVSRDVPIGKRFFAAMDKTEKIREDCRVLMAGEDGPTKAGLDIIASTSSHLEQAYEKIFRWCSHEFLQIGRDSQLEVSSTMREAIQRLKKRPELLTEALTSLSQTRQSTLQTSFLNALTRGGPSGLPRPIELHAHDPMRYIGDMLAWVHQAIAAEREFLESLFGIKSDGRMVGSVRVFGEKRSEEEDWIRELMDLAVGRLCVPMKIRVQQTIKSQESSITSYRIVNLLQFYLHTMRHTIGKDAILSKALEELTEMAYKSFFDSIETQCKTLQRVELEPDDSSLTPPIPILDHAQILREIMTVYQSSIFEDANASDQIAGFKEILEVMVNPAVEMCISAAERKKSIRPKWDMEVFILNCLTYLLSVLEPFDFTVEKQKSIQDLVNTRVEHLTDDHYRDLMADAGLQEVAATCEKHDNSEPLSHVPSTQPSELQVALRNFSLWLSGPEVVHSSRLSSLTLQRLHNKIHQTALTRMAKAYEVICEQVRMKENRYEAASTLLGGERPFGQVALLWQIFGLREDGV